MTTTIHVNRLRHRIDFAIITIREDEFAAVLQRFLPRKTVLGGAQIYEFCCLKRPDGRSARIAIVRTFDQGHNAAQAVAHNVIFDLAPRWLILTGIAGGVPDHEFSLGDVLLASRVHDLSITAAIEAQEPQFRPTGGPVHPIVGRLIAHMPAWRERLGDWNSDSSIGRSKPMVAVPDDVGATCYYGTDSTRETVRDSLKAHFSSLGPVRRPLFRVGSVATANVLLKDSSLLAEWKRVARDITHIEMEAGGVYVAARSAPGGEVPLLCIRGLSDIVGFKRAPEWTQFACDSAASFLHALLSLLPIGVFRTTPQGPLSELLEKISALPSFLAGIINSTQEFCVAGAAYVADLAKGRLQRAPTIDEITESFARSSNALLSWTVPPDKYVPRPELESLANSYAFAGPKVTCLLGGPGSGKTTLLALLTKRAIEAGIITLAVKADQLPRDVSFEEWTHQQLGVSLSALDAVKAAATRARVLVVVDQLDALASTVDLTSNRLNSILAFIASCDRLPHVSVVCSCRTFEFQYDARFGSLNAHVVNLELPSWIEVQSQLVRQGVSGAQTLPEAFREILRTPQHLHVYLTRFAATGRADAFGSYHLMLDDLWARNVNTESEREFLLELTEYLVENELLWAPAIRFERFSSSMTSLHAKGFLQLQGRQVGFCHQTLLEHAKARLFASRGLSLSAYVLARQDAILVRPTVWSVLTYLRDVDRQTYQRELQQLFSAELRLHLRYLLIDHLGQTGNPEDFEIKLLAGCFASPDWRIRGLIAISGKARWFDALRPVQLSEVMQRPTEEQWPMITVIGSAWESHRDACLQLIESHWLPFPDKDGLTWRAMNLLSKWDERAVEIVCTIIRRSEGEGDRLYWAESLVDRISADQPQLAPRVFVETVTRLNRAGSTISD